MHRFKSPWLVAGVGLLALAYLVSPIDFVPDFLPLVGWIDDVGAVLTAAMVAVGQWSKKSPASAVRLETATAYEPLSPEDLRAL